MSTLDHIKINVQVWDGWKFSLVPEAEAKKLAKAGTHQICTNLQATELKRPEEFKAPKKRASKARSKPAKYDNKQMKTDD